MTSDDPKSEGLAVTVAGNSGGRDDVYAAPIEIAASFERRFHVHGEIARGGMGRVALATDITLRREVAVKELLEGHDPANVRRFEREALITARLQHPGVVGVYDFARRGDGVAALVMRRVRGRPFDHAIRDASSFAGRLELLPAFISACDAVAYAHREGVIHRDLKPANVLLGDFGDTVVIDWGLAKDLRASPPASNSVGEMESVDRVAVSQLTAMGAVMGTPSYMAPEQARGEPADTRSDVYALGTMLYQLLAGRTPYEGTDSRAVVGALLSGPPPPLLSREAQVQPELVTVVERAMARDRAARYPDAGELAAELKRFQTGQLVASHRYTTGELFARWARKHAAALTVSLIAFLVLAIGGGIAIHTVIASGARARQEAESSKQLAEFMTGIFKAADESGASASKVTAQELLDHAAGQVMQHPPSDELVAAQLMKAIGDAYFSLGVRRPALPLFERALEIRARRLGPAALGTLIARNAVSKAESYAGRYADAEAMLRATLALAARAKIPPTDAVYLESEHLLGDALIAQGRYAEAESVARAYLGNALHSSTSKRDQQVAKGYAMLANAISRQGRFTEALALHQEAAALLSAHPDVGPRDLLRTQCNIAVDEYQLHHYAAAEKLQLELRRKMVEVLGPLHPDTLILESDLATTYSAEKKYAEAEALELKALAAQRQRVGPESQIALFTLYNLACTTALEGQPDRALRYLTELVGVGVPREADIEHDADLASLRGKPAFEALLARVRAQRATPPSSGTAAPAALAAPRTPPASKTPPPARR